MRRPPRSEGVEVVEPHDAPSKVAAHAVVEGSSAPLNVTTDAGTSIGEKPMSRVSAVPFTLTKLPVTAATYPATEPIEGM